MKYVVFYLACLVHKRTCT